MKVGIVMGSVSDLPVVEKGIKVLQEFGVPVEVRVLSAHRCPEEARDFAATAREKGFSVLIAAAGMATNLDGMDALLSTVMMPSGIPVATVAIDGAKNAALLAIQILAVTDADLAEKLAAARKKETDAVLAKDAELLAKYH